MLIVPTVLLPPVTPFTFQTTAVFAVFDTVAVNCRVRLMRTLALDGDTVTLTATTFTDTVFDTSPSGVFTTTGTPVRGLEALAWAVRRVADTNVVGSAVPPNDTTDPGMKPAPFSVSVTLPTGIGDGLTLLMLGSGRIVTDALPLEDGDVVVVA